MLRSGVILVALRRGVGDPRAARLTRLRRSRALIQESWARISRSAGSIAHAQAMNERSRNVIHTAEEQMAAQAGRLRLTYLTPRPLRPDTARAVHVLLPPAPDNRRTADPRSVAGQPPLADHRVGSRM
jgi:hypothetical protein